MPSLTITIPSRRIYPDRVLSKEAKESLALSFARSAVMTELFYNLLYDNKYLGGTYDVIPEMKKEYAGRYGTDTCPEYWYTSMYSTANGMLSSQKELVKLYDSEKKARLEHTSDKADDIKKELDAMQKVKAGIVKYSKKKKSEDERLSKSRKDGQFKYRLPKIRMNRYIPACVSIKREEGSPVYDGKALYTFELWVDGRIRDLKARYALVNERKKRQAEAVLDKTPVRITFGSRKEYRKKDTMNLQGQDLIQWHKDRDFRRMRVMHVSGRSDSPDGNWCCKYDPVNKTLRLFCMDRNWITIPGVEFPYREEDLIGHLAGMDSARSAGYTFELRRNCMGDIYMLVKASFRVDYGRLNDSLDDGCIAFDTNYDNLAWSELSKDGNRLDGGVIPFDPEGTSGQISDRIGRACTELMSIAKDKKKPVVKENLDTEMSKQALRYGSRKRNHRISMFAHSKVDAFIKGKCYRNGISVLEAAPEYTSQSAKMKYMRIFGISIHEAASYTIGRRALGYSEKIPAYLRCAALYDKRKQTGGDPLYKRWRLLTKIFKKASQSMFYIKYTNNTPKETLLCRFFGGSGKLTDYEKMRQVLAMPG